MKNLKPKSYQDGKRTRYSYYPAESGKMIKITISHRDGGMNYFSGSAERRGIEVGVSEVDITPSGTRGVMMESTTPFDDVNGRLLVLEVPRYSAKKLDAVAEVFDERVPEISRLWREDREAGRKLLFETAELAKAA